MNLKRRNCCPCSPRLYKTSNFWLERLFRRPFSCYHLVYISLDHWLHRRVNSNNFIVPSWKFHLVFWPPVSQLTNHCSPKFMEKWAHISNLLVFKLVASNWGQMLLLARMQRRCKLLESWSLDKFEFNLRSRYGKNFNGFLSIFGYSRLKLFEIMEIAQSSSIYSRMCENLNLIRIYMQIFNNYIRYMPTQQDLHSVVINKRRWILISIKLLFKLLNRNGGVGRHTMVLSGFLNLLLHVNPLVSDWWVDDIYEWKNH